MNISHSDFMSRIRWRAVPWATSRGLLAASLAMFSISCQYYPSAYQQSYGYQGAAGSGVQRGWPPRALQPAVQSARRGAVALGQRMESRHPVWPTNTASTIHNRGRRRVPNAATTGPGILGTSPQPVAAPSWQGAPTYPTTTPPSQAAAPYPTTGYAPAPIPGYGMPSANAYPTGGNPYPGAAGYPTATGTGGQSYTIQKGDTLSGIAARYGVSLSSLLSANGLSMQSIIHPNNSIIIPSR